MASFNGSEPSAQTALPVPGDQHHIRTNDELRKDVCDAIEHAMFYCTSHSIEFADEVLKRHPASAMGMVMKEAPSSPNATKMYEDHIVKVAARIVKHILRIKDGSHFRIHIACEVRYLENDEYRHFIDFTFDHAPPKHRVFLEPVKIHTVRTNDNLHDDVRDALERRSDTVKVVYEGLSASDSNPMKEWTFFLHGTSSDDKLYDDYIDTITGNIIDHGSNRVLLACNVLRHDGVTRYRIACTFGLDQ